MGDIGMRRRPSPVIDGVQRVGSEQCSASEEDKEATTTSIQIGVEGDGHVAGGPPPPQPWATSERWVGLERQPASEEDEEAAGNRDAYPNQS
jgi:hypothetical protein